MKNPTDKTSAIPERRRSRRLDAVQKIKYKVLIPMEGQGFTQNISEGGFALFLDHEVPPGSVLALRFEDRDEGAAAESIIVKVVWQKDHLAGTKVLGR
jgi:c-di-GMP-binding flagellar brake protein YcgR